MCIRKRLIISRRGANARGDNEMEFAEGEAYHIPAGHDAWVVGDEPYVGLDIVDENTWAKPS